MELSKSHETMLYQVAEDRYKDKVQLLLEHKTSVL